MKPRSIYLVAYYMMKPKTHRVNTSVKGWMSNPNNISYEEQIAVTNRLKDKDLNMAKVILDLTNRSVYRNSWSEERSFDDLFEHFYSGYPQYLDPVIKQLGYEMVSKEELASPPPQPTDTISSTG